jgi:hypothetical protein
LEIIIISLEITRNNYFMARPSKVTEADKKSIAVRVANGVDMEALAKEYGFTTVKRIEQIAKEYGAKKNANAPLVDEYISNCQKNQAIIETVHQQGGAIGEFAFMEKVKQKLSHAKLTPIISNMHELLERVSASRVVYEKINIGDGVQNMEPREVGVQDAKEIKSLMDAVSNYSILVGATDPRQPTVAIQNNQTNNQSEEGKTKTTKEPLIIFEPHYAENKD